MTDHSHQPVNILFICHEGALYGAQQSLKLLIDGLQTSYANDGNSRPFAIKVSVARPGPLIDQLRSQGITVITHKRLPWFKHSQRNLLQRLSDSLALVYNAFYRVPQLKTAVEWADIVHTNSVVSLEGALAAKWYGKPHIWHIREWLTPDNPGLFPVLPMALTRWLIQRLSDRVVCISTAVQHGVFGHQAGRDKALLLPNVVKWPADTLPTDKLPCPQRPERFIVGFVGRFSTGKRVTDLITAFDGFCQQLSITGGGTTALNTALSPQLWLMGQAENAKDAAIIEQALAKCEHRHRIITKGFVNDLANIYPQLTLLALPASNEAFGRVLIEAMACGVPCFGANAGGIPDIIDTTPSHQTGWLYPVGDITQLTTTLQKAWNCWQHEAVTWQVIQHNAQQRVTQNYLPDAQLSKLKNLYRSLCIRLQTD
jgi:glycosyltransferase involved in cell wall biosynthesis